MGERDELESVRDLLDAYTVPDPTQARTAALIERLRPLTPAPVRRRFRKDGLAASPVELALGLIQAQVRLLRPAWWLCSAVAVLLWVALAEWTGLTLGLLAPPLVAAGTSWGMRSVGTPALEVELSCPARPGHVVMTRMLLVMSWVALLGAGAALAVGGSIWSALAGWSAGLLLFGGMALVATLWAGPRGAFALMVLTWMALTLWRLMQTVERPLWVLPDGPAAALGAALLAAGLLWSGRLHPARREEA